MNKEDFPILKRKVNEKPLVYLDNAASTQKPSIVIDAVRNYYEQHNANIHRGLHKLSEEATLMYEEAHDTASKFVGCEFEEMVFTKNTTESLNLAAYSLLSGLKSGDEIVLTRLEHHSNLVPWQQLAKAKGVVVKYIDLLDDGSLDVESAKSVIGDKTKIVASTHISNALGTVVDIVELGKMAHAHDALMVVDGAQSVPHLPVNVKKLDCDFLAFSGHKMCGPTGIGGLYGRKELLDRMTPFLYGGEMIREVSYEDTRFNDLPWKFEAGTTNIAGAVGLKVAVDYLNTIGMENIHAHTQKLLDKATKRLEEIDKLKIIGTAKEKGGIISFDVEGIPPHDMSTILDSQGVAIRAGHHCTMPLMKRLGVNGTSRASFYLYNEEEDIETLAQGILKAKEVFSV